MSRHTPQSSSTAPPPPPTDDDDRESIADQAAWKADLDDNDLIPPPPPIIDVDHDNIIYTPSHNVVSPFIKQKPTVAPVAAAQEDNTAHGVAPWHHLLLPMSILHACCTSHVLLAPHIISLARNISHVILTIIIQLSCIHHHRGGETPASKSPLSYCWRHHC